MSVERVGEGREGVFDSNARGGWIGFDCLSCTSASFCDAVSIFFQPHSNSPFPLAPRSPRLALRILKNRISLLAGRKGKKRKEEKE